MRSRTITTGTAWLAVLALLLAALATATAPTARAADTGGTVVAWGGNTEVPDDLGDVVAISAGWTHSLALRADGTVAAWGGNVDGQTDVPTGLDEVTAVSAGAAHSLALRADGTVVAWGANRGMSDWGQTDVPAGLDGVIAIAAGYLHSLALRHDGTVIPWGDNGHGQSDVPAGLDDAVAIADGVQHSLALRADGTVVAWGVDDVFHTTQVPAGLDDVTAIAASGHNLALRADGTVVAWGNNLYGQTDVPAGLDDAVAVAAAEDYSLALRADGTVVAWGWDLSEPTNVPSGLVGVTAIAAGAYHSLALVAEQPADVTPPMVTIASPSDGAEVPVGAVLTASYTCADEDGGSGLASCTGAVDGVPVEDGGAVPTSAPGERTLTVTGTDHWGNWATATATYTVLADATPPSIAITAPAPGAATTVGGALTAGYSCADESGGSGLASCVGSVAGAPVADGAALPTGVLGAHTLTVVATDHAGNTATATAGYAVLADAGTLGGRLTPAPTVSGGFKAGSVIPVQVDLGADYGEGILAAGSPTVTSVECTTGEPVGPAAAPGHPSGLRHEPLSTSYVYTWKTKRGMAETCQRVDLVFSDAAGPYAGGHVAYIMRFDR